MNWETIRHNVSYVVGIAIAIAIFVVWAMPKTYTTADYGRDGRCHEWEITESLGGMIAQVKIVYTYPSSQNPCR